jgi:hypothetical protein
MIVRADFRRVDPPPARHAKVKDQRVAAIGFDESIFGPASKAGDGRARQPLTQIHRDREAQVGAARFDAREDRPFQHAAQASDSGFDFGQFRHANPSSRDDREHSKFTPFRDFLLCNNIIALTTVCRTGKSGCRGGVFRLSRS